MEIPDEMFNFMVDNLKKIQQNLQRACDLSGASSRAERIREEIKSIGWNRIMEKYHPDVNMEDPAANPLFEFYKFIYDDMRRKGEIA